MTGVQTCALPICADHDVERAQFTVEVIVGECPAQTESRIVDEQSDRCRTAGCSRFIETGGDEGELIRIREVGDNDLRIDARNIAQTHRKVVEERLAPSDEDEVVSGDCQLPTEFFAEP